MQWAADEEGSLWDTEPTVARYMPHLRAEALAPAQEAQSPAANEPEPEFVDAEEIPVSSSDAPTLMALTVDAEQLRSKRQADGFQVNLSAGTGGILTAPTIDVSDLSAPPQASARSAASAARSGTIPLFDMSAVLPSAEAAKFGATSPAPAREIAPAANVPASSGRVRERKFVILSEQAITAPEKTRRRGTALWFGLAAALAGVVAMLGVRAYWFPQRRVAVAETPATVEPSSATLPVATATAALPAPAQTVIDAPIEDVPNAGTTRNPTFLAPTTVAAAATTVRRVANGTSNSAQESAPPPQKTTTANKPVLALGSLEKPPAIAKRTEIHNAPPAAEPGTEFDRAAARSALASAASQASACRKEGDPSGTASITITFAPSGRVTSANLQGPPFAGTATGGCIASTMRRANVPAFSGEYVTVTKVIVVQ